MLIALFIVALAIVLFLCLYLGFREGLRLAKLVSEGKDIPKIKSPMQAIQEHKENKEQAEANKAYNEGLNAILSYDGSLPKEQR